jgi:hypothetical protein
MENKNEVFYMYNLPYSTYPLYVLESRKHITTQKLVDPKFEFELGIVRMILFIEQMHVVQMHQRKDIVIQEEKERNSQQIFLNKSVFIL